jgi:hypothetical protein
MLLVLRNSAHFQVSLSMSNVPSRSFVRPPLVKVQVPAAICYSSPTIAPLASRLSFRGFGSGMFTFTTAGSTLTVGVTTSFVTFTAGLVTSSG